MKIIELSVRQLQAVPSWGIYVVAEKHREAVPLAKCDCAGPASLFALLPRFANLEELLYVTVRKAQEILTNRLQDTTVEETLSDLYELFDGEDWRMIEELRNGIKDEMRTITLE